MRHVAASIPQPLTYHGWDWREPLSGELSVYACPECQEATHIPAGDPPPVCCFTCELDGALLVEMPWTIPAPLRRLA